MTFKDMDWNEVLQLVRLTCETAQGERIAVQGRLHADGIYQLPEYTDAFSIEVREAAKFARGLALGLLKAGVIESSDTDTAYVPFVVPQKFTLEELLAGVPDWLGLVESGDVSVSAGQSGFWVEEALQEHVEDDDVDEYYDPQQVRAIRAAAKKFKALGQAVNITVTAGHVAHLIVNLAPHSSGFWTGLATLRVDT